MMSTPSTLSQTVIRTKRLLLRAARDEDLPAFHKWLSDPESMNYWYEDRHGHLDDTGSVDAILCFDRSHAAHTSLEQSQDFVDRMIESTWNGILDFAVCLVEHDPSSATATLDDEVRYKVIGKAGLYDGAEVGFLFDRDYWGKGYAYEALDAIVKHAWAIYVWPTFSAIENNNANGNQAQVVPTRIDKIKADVDPRNAASLRVLKKLGFVETGTALRTYETHLGWCDSVYLELKRPSEST